MYEVKVLFLSMFTIVCEQHAIPDGLKCNGLVQFGELQMSIECNKSY